MPTVQYRSLLVCVMVSDVVSRRDEDQSGYDEKVASGSES
jgi:hypothetical protein